MLIYAINMHVHIKRGSLSVILPKYARNKYESFATFSSTFMNVWECCYKARATNPGVSCEYNASHLNLIYAGTIKPTVLTV